MDDRRIGAAVRILRTRRRLRQRDVAASAGVARHVVGAIERGRLGRVTVDQLRAVVEATGAWLEQRVRSAGGDVYRLLDAGHAELSEVVTRRLVAEGWQVWPEVSFSIFGERGVIDLLAWHPGRRALLVIELKTLLVDFGDLLATMDRRLRLAVRIAEGRIAEGRGLSPLVVGGWVAVTDSSTNRRRLADHVTLVRAAFPDDGRSVAAWLREPDRPLRALGFLSHARQGTLSQGRALPRRVRVPRPRASGTAAERGTARPGIADARKELAEPRIGVPFRG